MPHSCSRLQILVLEAPKGRSSLGDSLDRSDRQRRPGEFHLIEREKSFCEAVSGYLKATRSIASTRPLPSAPLTTCVALDFTVSSAWFKVILHPQRSNNGKSVSLSPIATVS